MPRDGWAALPRGATGLSAVCDCGISWSYSLTISYMLNSFNFHCLHFENKINVSPVTIDIFYSFVGHDFMLSYEGCSNTNASSFITFFTYMLWQNIIPFWKELFVALKMTPNIKKHSLYFLSYKPLYKGHSCILKQIAMHVLVYVRIYCHIFVSIKQMAPNFRCKFK